MPQSKAMPFDNTMIDGLVRELQGQTRPRHWRDEVRSDYREIRVGWWSEDYVRILRTSIIVGSLRASAIHRAARIAVQSPQIVYYAFSYVSLRHNEYKVAAATKTVKQLLQQKETADPATGKLRHKASGLPDSLQFALKFGLIICDEAEHDTLFLSSEGQDMIDLWQWYQPKG